MYNNFRCCTSCCIVGNLEFENIQTINLVQLMQEVVHILRNFELAQIIDYNVADIIFPI